MKPDGMGHADPPGDGAGLGANVIPFRRSQGPPRRKRRSVWRKLMRPLSSALAILGVPLAGGLWVATAPQFALREISVEGAGRVSESWIRARLAPLLGRNLPLLPLAAAVDRLSIHPWVESLEIAKELPGRLVVRVAEKQPAVFLRSGGRLFWADAAGKPIAPLSAKEAADEIARERALAESNSGPGGPGAPSGFLVVSFATPVPNGVARALGVAAELGKANPDWAARLAEIEVLGEEDFRLRIGVLPFPVLVRDGDVIDKVHRLETLLPRLAERYPTLGAVDLRFSHRIVVQPAAEGASAGARSEEAASRLAS
jgi:cell division septal protein FtsQ